MKRALLASAVAIAASATPALADAPGIGWSRANDLQVYGAMDMARDLAREQDVFCTRRNPARIHARWQERFGAREAAVTSALVARYGADAVALVEYREGDKPSCAIDEADKWHRAHAKLLRTLELRVAGYGSRG